MAAAIVTKSTTLEGQLFEIALAIQLAELQIPEADRPNRMTVDVTPEDKTASITFNGDAFIAIDATTGQMVSTIAPYLP
jgi:hypothetical protein